MNNYILFLNGLLMPPNFMEIRQGTNPTDGIILRLVGENKKIKDRVPDLSDIDVMEVRASNFVRRFRWMKSADEDGRLIDLKEIPATDETPARTMFTCKKVPNAF